MGEFAAVLVAKLVVALIESDGFMVLAHHVYQSITCLFL
jgi:hypothetical protein